MGKDLYLSSRVTIELDQTSAQCPIIERTVNRLKCYRRIAIHYEKLANAYPAMVTIAEIPEWL